eukprot:scaffold268324_cov31-Tisochrysis_lutea.AAC.5
MPGAAHNAHQRRAKHGELASRPAHEGVRPHVLSHSLVGDPLCEAVKAGTVGPEERCEHPGEALSLHLAHTLEWDAQQQSLACSEPLLLQIQRPLD